MFVCGVILEELFGLADNNASKKRQEISIILRSSPQPSQLKAERKIYIVFICMSYWESEASVL